MNDERLSRQIDFLGEIEKLKTVSRANRTTDGRAENSAEHSWHVALMALLLAEHADADLDWLRVTRMLLVHDIVEIDAGDTWLYAADQGSKPEAENRAAERLYALLPDDQYADYLLLWREFEARETDEAKFAAAIDGLQPLLNHLLTGRADERVIAAGEVLAKKAYIRDCAPALWPLVERLVRDSRDKGLYD